MSALLRGAVRELLEAVNRPDVPLFARLADLVSREERAGRLEPHLAHTLELSRAAALVALRHFQKPTGHFIGCTGDPCTSACLEARAALNPTTEAAAGSIVAALRDTCTVLERERRSAWKRVAYLEAHALKRGPGRPKKKTPPIFSDEPASDTSGSRATRA